MRLTPSERSQLTALLGALGSGLQGTTALQIFGGIESDIQARQQQQRARQQQLRAAAIQQAEFRASQEAEMQRYLLGQQNSMERYKLGLLQDQQQTHDTYIQSILGKLIPQAFPEATTTTTKRTNPDYGTAGSAPGTPQFLTTTETQTHPQASYQDLMSQLGAFVAAAPGGTSAAEFGDLSGALDQLYTLDPETLQGMYKDALNGVAQGHSADSITRQMQAQGRALGFGSPDEQKQIAAVVSRAVNTGGPVGADPGISGYGQGSAEISSGGGPMGALNFLSGVGTLYGTYKLGKFAKNKLFGTQETAIPAEAEAQVAGPLQDALASLGYIRPAGELPATIAGGPIEAGPGGTIPGGPTEAGPPGRLALPSRSVLSEVGSVPGGRYAGTFNPGTSGEQLLDIGGIPRAPRFGPANDVLGALGAVALPLQGLDIWAQQRNATNFYNEWASASQADRAQYLQRNAASFPPDARLTANGDIVDSQGYVLDPMSGQRTGSAYT